MFGFKDKKEAWEKEQLEIEVEKKKLAGKVKELIDFRGLNEKFNYLGLDMIVLSHSHDYYAPYWRHHSHTRLEIPRLKAKYVDKAGHIQISEFNYSELPALIAENLID